METKASHVLIGAFTLALVVGVFGFVLWLGKVEIDSKMVVYATYFEESVSGLGLAGDVRYNGVPVGNIMQIDIDPDNPGRVRVTLEVRAGTPINSESVATLDFLGITGVSYIQITGGSPKAVPLVAAAGDPYPVIPSRPSPLTELFTGAPDLVNRATILVSRISKLVDDGNVEVFGRILANLETVTGSLAARAETFERLLSNAEISAAELTQTAKSVRTLTRESQATLASLNGLLEDEIPGFLAAATKGAGSFDELATHLDEVVAENRQALGDFTSAGLSQLLPLMIEMTELMETLSRVAERLESDPARFLFGTQESEFEAK